MAVVAAAPCQCFSPGENKSTSPDELWLEGDVCVPKVGGWNCKNFKPCLPGCHRTTGLGSTADARAD
jgi:hypothetical protein